MSRIEVVNEIEVCQCCLSMIANGDNSGCDFGCGAEHVNQVNAGLDRLSTQGNVVPACDEDCEGWFSWSDCDVCQSGLGGDRHKAAILGEVSK